MAKNLVLVAIFHAFVFPFTLAQADDGVPRAKNSGIGPIGTLSTTQTTASDPALDQDMDPDPDPDPAPSPSPSPAPSPAPNGVASPVNPAVPQSGVPQPAPGQQQPPAGMPMMPMMPMMPGYSSPNIDDYGDDNDELYGGGGGGARGVYGGASDNTPTSSRTLTGGYKIVGPFKEEFDKCLAKVGLGTSCKFENWGIMGDKAHQRRRSCHNIGEAIDVGPIHCDGVKYDSKHPKFIEMAKCMANDTGNKFKVLFHMTEPPNLKKAPNHEGHMHIQLKTCIPQKGRG